MKPLRSILLLCAVMFSVLGFSQTEVIEIDVDESTSFVETLELTVPTSTVRPKSVIFRNSDSTNSLSLTVEDTGWHTNLSLMSSESPDMTPNGTLKKSFRLQYKILDADDEAVELSAKQRSALQKMSRDYCGYIASKTVLNQSEALKVERAKDKDAGLKITDAENELQVIESDLLKEEVRSNCHVTIYVEATNGGL